MKSAIFPGSFDPFTIGHANIVERGLQLFDHIYIGIGNNSEKQRMFSCEWVEQHIKDYFGNDERLSIERYEGLTIDFAKRCDARFILRGARTTQDFEYERSIAQFNKEEAGLETIILFTAPELAHISSTLVRDLKKNNIRIDKYIC